MNEQISLAFSILADGISSYAITVITESGETRSINMSSQGSDEIDNAFIADLQKAISDYRQNKGF
jgi:hypothetical protein